MNKILAATLALSLAGCVPGGTPTQMVTAMTGLSGVTQATQPASKADLAMSCKDMNSRLNNLYARYNQLEAEQQAKQRKQAMVDGALGIGLGVLGTGMAANAGSVSAIHNVQTAYTVAEGATALSSAERNSTQLKDVTDATAIAARAAQLERLKVEKGC